MRILKNFPAITKYFALIFIYGISQHFFAQTKIQLDTVLSYPVGPGMTYTKYIEHSAPWTIDVFEADMTNKYFSLETVKAFEKLAGGREKTSELSKRRNSINHWSVGAINADFFDLKTGLANNVEVIKGQVLRAERTDWPAFGYNDQKKISFSKPTLKGEIILQDTTLSMDGINVSRDTNTIIFYNKYFGDSTFTNDFGFEAIISPSNSWMVNDTIICKVESISKNGYNTEIPDDKMVISASGLKADYLKKHFAENIPIKILLKIYPSVPNLKEMVGGYPIIIEDGESLSLNPNHAFIYTKHPRTAVGINKDSTKLLFVTVDGRQSSSIGMNLYELADLMLKLGAYHAMNLDGGGSTAMVVRNKIMNSPSDSAGERPVSNVLLVISTAPKGNLTNIRLSPKFEEVNTGGEIQFTTEGMDEFYNPIEIDEEKVIYSFNNSAKEEISSSGLFNAGKVPGECSVIARYGNLSDSAKVYINIPKE